MRFLVGGLARSGTTWFAETLASAPGFQYIHEPDTLTTDPFAWIGTRGIKFQEPIPPGTRMPNYQLMWDVAYSGGWRGAAPLLRRLALNRKLPKVVNIASSTTLARIARRRKPPTPHQLVKSVRVLMTIEWIADRYRPKVAVVWRSPLNMLASVRANEMAMSFGTAIQRRYIDTVAWPPPGDPDGKAAWTICARLGVLLEIAGRHPDWMVVRHESVAADPTGKFRDVFARLEIPWAPEVEAFLAASNEPGSGWETKRVASKEATRWKERLSADQIRTAGGVMERFSTVEGVGPIFAECLSEMG